MQVVKRIDQPIPPGQFLVYFYLARDGVRCDREGNFLTGRNEAGLLFPTLPEAETFARAEAEAHPKLGAGIYDSSWHVMGEFVSAQFRADRARAEAPHRLFLWAGLLILGGSAFLYWEVHSGWTFVIGFLIGTRLLLSGILQFAKAVDRWWRRAGPR